MIARYTRAEMGRIWSDEGRFQRWLEVELAATDTLAERGVVPKKRRRAFASGRAWTPRAFSKSKAR